ncbi:MAG: universal stress protein [Deltaproteobacteria bacterium]|nr:universal stress protein [Deltaproteobacteria bacterium]
MLTKILYPVDFSCDVTLSILQTLKKLKKNGLKEVVLLHILDEGAFNNLSRYVASFADLEKMRSDNYNSAQKLMDDLAVMLAREGISVRTIIRWGDPASEILKVDQEEGSPVTIIGSHGMDHMRAELMKSKSEVIVRKSTAPVFVVKMN